MAASERGLAPTDVVGCPSADAILAHLDRQLDGESARDVRDHLDTCEPCRAVMADAARDIGSPKSSSPSSLSVLMTLAPGELVAGRYEIRRFIARGGMGEVYEAFDSALGEGIALKTLTITSVDRSDAVRRLRAEVRLARRITHPNVCRILEFGTHSRRGASDDPIPFLTMPLLRGETLARRLKRNGRLSSQEAVRILDHLAMGLTAVHQAGVIHRDFKPENVFLVESEDGSERPVVMDFGLARALETRADGDPSTGQLLIGTPAYMAPEQVEGRLLTKAADIYALGVVGFELLTGRLPFVAETAAGLALARLRQRVVPPSSLVGGLDKRWDELIGQCLKLLPEQRFASVGEFSAALERIRGGTRRPSAVSPAVWIAVGMAAVAGTIWIAASGSSRTVGVETSSVPPPFALARPDQRPAPERAISTAPTLPTASSAPRRERSMTSAKSRAVPAPPALAPPAAESPSIDTTGAAADDVFDKSVGPRLRQADDLIDPFAPPPASHPQ